MSKKPHLGKPEPEFFTFAETHGALADPNAPADEREKNRLEHEKSIDAAYADYLRGIANAQRERKEAGIDVPTSAPPLTRAAFEADYWRASAYGGMLRFRNAERRKNHPLKNKNSYAFIRHWIADAQLRGKARFARDEHAKYAPKPGAAKRILEVKGIRRP